MVARGGDVPTALLRRLVDESGVGAPEIARRMGWIRTQVRRRRLVDGSLGRPYTVSWADATRLRTTLGIKGPNVHTSFAVAAAVCAAVGIDPADHGIAPRPDEERTCLGCGRTLPLERFHRAALGHRGRDSRCISCKTDGRREHPVDRVWRPARPPRAHQTLAERFWEKVDRTGGECWRWRGATSARGRGEINVDGRPQSASRVAWQLVRGETLGPGVRLTRTCLTRSCVRPDHHEPVEVRGGHPLGARAVERRRLIEALDAQEHQRLVDYQQVVRRDPCSYCGAPATTADHITALARGGTADWSNLTASCSPCNNVKFTDSLLIWLWKRGGGQRG